MGEIIKVIEAKMIDNIFTIICFVLSTIAVMVIMVIDKKKRRDKYMVWKKQTLNLVIYSKEWERTDDAVLQQLFDENQRLENENKLLKKEKSKLSFVLLLSTIFSIFILWLTLRFDRKRKDI